MKVLRSKSVIFLANSDPERLTESIDSRKTNSKKTLSAEVGGGKPSRNP